MVAKYNNCFQFAAVPIQVEIRWERASSYMLRLCGGGSKECNEASLDCICVVGPGVRLLRGVRIMSYGNRFEKSILVISKGFSACLTVKLTVSGIS